MGGDENKVELRQRKEPNKYKDLPGSQGGRLICLQLVENFRHCRQSEAAEKSLFLTSGTADDRVTSRRSILRTGIGIPVVTALTV